MIRLGNTGSVPTNLKNLARTAVLTNASAVLADEEYQLLVEYWGTRDTSLEKLEIESKALEKLREDGTANKISELSLDDGI